MSDMGFTPPLTATGNILPFSFVKIVSSAPFSGAACTAQTDYPVGVTDGSVYQFGATYNAVSGTRISLQPSNTVQVVLGGTVAAGDYLESDANGAAVTAGDATAVSAYIALESGVSGNVVRAWRFGYRGPVFS